MLFPVFCWYTSINKMHIEKTTYYSIGLCYHCIGRFLIFSVLLLFIWNFTVANSCECITHGNIWSFNSMELCVVYSLAAHDVYIETVYEHCLQSDDSQIIRNSVLKVRDVSLMLIIWFSLIQYIHFIVVWKHFCT